MKSLVFRKELNGVDAYTRHKNLLKSYASYAQNPNKDTNSTTSYNPEYAILQKHHKFIRRSDDIDKESTITWEQRLAKKYYDQLFKEYALCELSYYKQGRIALRWRTEDEVVIGKGQFICASTKCDRTQDLTSWEVNFGYMEDGIKKNELVKVRLCIDCSQKLNYKTHKRMAKRKEQDSNRKRRRISDSEDNSNDDAPSGDDVSTRKKSKTKARQRGDDDHTSSDKHNDHDPSSVWSKDLVDSGEKTKEEEFEDYFAELLQ